MNPTATFVEPLTKLFATNVTSASITPPIPTVTEPVGDGIQDSFDQSDQAPKGWGANIYWFHFYGARTADDQTMTALIVAWRKVGVLWIPTQLLGLDITLGLATGVSSQPVASTDYIADTIAVTSGKEFTKAYEIISPANDGIAAAKIDVCGEHKIQVLLAKGTNTNCNALAAGF